MSRRNMIIVVAVLVIGALGFAGYQRFAGADPSPAGEWQTIAVERGTIMATINASGSVAPEAKVTLAFKVPGRVAEVLVEEDDWVEAGEALARLETADMEVAVAQAEAALATAQASLAQVQAGARTEEIAAAEGAVAAAKANLAGARANLAAAQADLARVKAGAREEEIAIAEGAVSAAKANLAGARANQAAAQADLARVKAGARPEEIAAAEAGLKQAETMLEQAQKAYDMLSWQPGSETTPLGYAWRQATHEWERVKAQVDLVKAGATAEQVAAAQALVDAARAQADGAQAQVTQAQAQLDLLRAGASAEQVAAAQALVDASQAQVEGAQAQVTQAQARLDLLKAGASTEQVAVVEAQVDQARAALKQAELPLGETTIVAPFAGTVAYVGIEVGELTSSVQPAVILVDLSSFHIDVRVDETDIGRISVGQEVSITLDAYPDVELEGRVARIDPVGTVIQGIVSYRVTMEIAPTEVPIKPDMTANVDIVMENKEGILLVPNRAIGRDREGEYVEIPAEGQPQKVYIETGLSNGTFTEVVAGLKKGERVIIKTQQQRIRDEMMEMMGQ